MRNIDKYEEDIKLFTDCACQWAFSKNSNRVYRCGLITCESCIFYKKCNVVTMTKWLLDEYKEPSILDEVEKQYLENLLRPFKDRVKYVRKNKTDYYSEWLFIELEKGDYCSLPCFKLDTMYKGMEKEKEYTLKELGLFENE